MEVVTPQGNALGKSEIPYRVGICNTTNQIGHEANHGQYGTVEAFGPEGAGRLGWRLCAVDAFVA